MTLLNLFRRNPVLIGLTLAAAAGMVYLSERAYWESVNTLEILGTMGAVRTQIHTLERGLLEAEAGQRGYLLTHRPQYLDPYKKALAEIDTAYKSLEPHYAADPTSRDILQRLHALTDTKLSELALTLELDQQGQNQASQEILLTDIGREKMDAIRATSAELMQYQNQMVLSRRTALFQALAGGRYGVALLGACILLALLVYLRQSQALRLKQMEIQRMVQHERDILEMEVARRTAELRQLANHLQTAREDERQRLARNLHDDLGSLLTSAKLDAARIKARLAGASPDALDLLAHLVGTLNSGIALGRSIIEDLRPSSLSDLGLVTALEILGREYAEASGVAVHCDLQPVPLRSSTELMAFRLVQEAITNISKYAQAQQIWITLRAMHDGQIEISVRDNGVGFDTRKRRESTYGLIGMRFRVEAEGGTLHLFSAPGQGTQVRAVLPEYVSAPAPLQSL